MNAQIPALAQCIAAIFGIFYNAAAVFPLLTALGLLLGRRENGRFCLLCGEKALFLAQILALVGSGYFIAAYFSALAPYLARGGGNAISPLLERAGLPYVSCLVAWILGLVCIYAAKMALAPLISKFNVPYGGYATGFIKFPLIYCFLGALFFFATFMLINWPFAGLPQNMDWSTAAMAIFRNGCDHCFRAFCPAGAIGLLYALHVFLEGSKRENGAIRWLAAWAAVGYIPWILQNWGYAIGVAMRGSASARIMSGMTGQVLALSFITAAIGCWIFIFISRRSRPFLAWLAFGLLVLKEISPFLANVVLD